MPETYSERVFGGEWAKRLLEPEEVALEQQLGPSLVWVDPSSDGEPNVNAECVGVVALAAAATAAPDWRSAACPD